jgi:hypothetical protein
MIELERTTTVEAQLNDVVDYLADFNHAQEWDAGTTSCERIDAGPAQVGARWHNVSGQVIHRRLAITFAAVSTNHGSCFVD